MESTFYTTAATIAFALLGLWWVVVAERRSDWNRLSGRRRQAYTVSLYFTLPGIMSLGSLVSQSDTTIWRLSFGIAGVLGLLEVIAGLWTARRNPSYRGRVGIVLALTLPFYLAVAVVAADPKIASDVGLNLKPLETEAIVVSILLFLGINFAWLLFFEDTGTPDRPAG